MNPIKQDEIEILTALKYLEFSYKKVQGRDLPPVQNADAEELEVWESFASRYGRLADLFVAKYVQARILRQDPTFRGELRDFLSRAEKVGLISNAGFWLGIRHDSYKIVNEYKSSDLRLLYSSLVNKCPIMVAEVRKILPP